MRSLFFSVIITLATFAPIGRASTNVEEQWSKDFSVSVWMKVDFNNWRTDGSEQMTCTQMNPVTKTMEGTNRKYFAEPGSPSSPLADEVQIGVVNFGRGSEKTRQVWVDDGLHDMHISVSWLRTSGTRTS
jgi:hypothetical protein